MPATEVVLDNELISPLVNNATFSQHAFNDYVTKSNSLARREVCCFSVEGVISCLMGSMLVIFVFC